MRNMIKLMIEILVMFCLVLFTGCGVNDSGYVYAYTPLPGPKGDVGDKGDKGDKGDQGEQGIPGQDGEDGDDAAPTPYTPVALVNPCGDAPGVYDEILIKLANGQLVASFSANANGNNTRFAVLTPGTYVTTDGDSCVFTVDSNGDITYENHHY